MAFDGYILYQVSYRAQGRQFSGQGAKLALLALLALALV